MLTVNPQTMCRMETYGERFRRLRVRAGFARESDAAKEIGVTREAIIQLEMGKTKELKGSNAVLAAEAFGVTTDYLITGIEIEGSSEIVEIWLKLDAKRRTLLLATAENLLSAQHNPEKPSARNPYPAAPMPSAASKKTTRNNGG